MINQHPPYPSWDTFERGPLCNEDLLYSVDVDYDGHPLIIDMGVFIGWGRLRATSERISTISSSLASDEFERLKLRNISHQCAGHRCGQAGMIATQVAISSSYVDFAKKLCRTFYHGRGGWLRPEPDQIYKAELGKYLAMLEGAGLRASRLSGVDCLTEAIYELESDAHTFDKFVADAATERARLGTLLNDPELAKTLAIYLLAENSD
jgi:hypothetical protein